MTYLRNSNRKIGRSYRKLLPIFIFAILLAGIFFLFRTGLQSASLGIFSPFFRAYHSAVENIKLGSRIFVPDYTLEKENVSLNAEIARLRQNVLDLEVMRLENEELREKLRLLPDNSLSASVLLSPPRTPYDVVMIDRGEYDGVAVGQRVLLGDRAALGAITKVLPNQSTVRLYSAPGSKTEVTIERTGAILELEGQGGGNFKVEVPLGFDVQEGDLALLQGLPRKLVASVAEVKTDEVSSFTAIYLRMPIPLLGDSPIYVEVDQ